MSEVVAEVPFFCIFLSFLLGFPVFPPLALLLLLSPPKRNLKGKQAKAPLGLLAGVVVVAVAGVAICFCFWLLLLEEAGAASAGAGAAAAALLLVSSWC